MHIPLLKFGDGFGVSDLGLGRKLALLGAVALLVCSVLMALQAWTAWNRISAMQQQIAGLAPAHALNEAIRLVQQHRGLGNVVLGGDRNSEPARASKQEEADSAMREFTALVERGITDRALRDAWQPLVDEWHATGAAVAQRKTDADGSFRSHTELITRLLDYGDRVLDHYRLMLAADQSRYLFTFATLNQLPRLAEILGQVRAVGSLLLASQSATNESKAQLAGLVARAATQLRELDQNLTRVFAHNQLAKEALGASVGGMRARAGKLLDLTGNQIVTAAALEYPASDYFGAATAGINTVYGLADTASQSLRAELEDARSALLVQQSALLAAVLLAMVLGLWLGFVIARSIVGTATLARDIASRIAAGNLAGEIPDGARDEMGALLRAMRNMQTSLSDVVGDVRGNAESVATASMQIAQGNQDLSQRTEEQASSLQQTAATMDELAATIKQNADNAQHANRLARDASEIALKGGEAMTRVVRTMDEISGSSRRIADIISTVDSIAFQTNILALNAAAEAARAGERGQGFAVVAGEVRALSQRSAQAAREIKDLVGASVEHVQEGSALVDHAGQTMREIVDSIRSVSDIVDSITTASLQQAEGVGQVGDAVGQMDQVTQQNAALVEQSAAAAQSLRDQAAAMMDSVSVFRLSSDVRLPAGCEHPGTGAAGVDRAITKPVGSAVRAPTGNPAPGRQRNQRRNRAHAHLPGEPPALLSATQAR